MLLHTWLTHARIAAVGVLMAAVSVSAQLDTRLGWSYISDAGNAPVPASISTYYNGRGVGRVDKGYWITTTEVTNEVWFDFVLTWAPYHQNYFSSSARGTGLTGNGIRYDFFEERYELKEDFRRYPIENEWRLAAIFANWLHNDRGSDESAFLGGAYEVSSFGGTTGNYTDQFEPSPGAKFWIPTMSEWVKAMHYDPDRYGEGEGGYWLYPHGKDERPIPGLPGIGETDQDFGSFGQSREVGLYADVMSPYGLFDGSGGAPEWTPTDFLNSAWYRLSETGGNGSLDASHIVFGESRRGISGDLGFRIASVVPAPGTVVFTIVSGLFVAGGTRQRSVLRTGRSPRGAGGVLRRRLPR